MPIGTSMRSRPAPKRRAPGAPSALAGSIRVAALFVLAPLLAVAPAWGAPSVGEPIVYVSPDGTLPETDPVAHPAAGPASHPH